MIFNLSKNFQSELFVGTAQPARGLATGIGLIENNSTCSYKMNWRMKSTSMFHHSTISNHELPAHGRRLPKKMFGNIDRSIQKPEWILEKISN